MQNSGGNQPHSLIGNGVCPTDAGNFWRFSTSMSILGALGSLRDRRIPRESWSKADFPFLIRPVSWNGDPR